jgi:hypothetical protein
VELWEAALWGFTGGAVAQLLRTAADVIAAGNRWPWRTEDSSDASTGGFGPYLFVACASILAGVGLAAAAHTQMTGAWPALIMGMTAPSVARGILSNFEAMDRRPDSRTSQPADLGNKPEVADRVLQADPPPIQRPAPLSENSEASVSSTFEALADDQR